MQRRGVEVRIAGLKTYKANSSSKTAPLACRRHALPVVVAGTIPRKHGMTISDISSPSCTMRKRCTRRGCVLTDTVPSDTDTKTSVLLSKCTTHGNASEGKASGAEIHDRPCAASQGGRRGTTASNRACIRGMQLTSFCYAIQ